jgi:hypothetical protein
MAYINASGMLNFHQKVLAESRGKDALTVQ